MITPSIYSPLDYSGIEAELMELMRDNVRDGAFTCMKHSFRRDDHGRRDAHIFKIGPMEDASGKNILVVCNSRNEWTVNARKGWRSLEVAKMKWNCRKGLVSKYMFNEIQRTVLIKGPLDTERVHVVQDKNDSETLKGSGLVLCGMGSMPSELRSIIDIMVEPNSEEATGDTAWPDPSIYGEPGIATEKTKKRSYGLYLAFGLGFLFAEALTYFIAVPASFDTGYQAAISDMRAALEAEARR